jgi:putative transcriptional regulator
LKVQPGTILISSPDLEDPNFDKVVIAICEYNTKGAMGFVINQPYDRNFNELLEFSNSKPFPLYEGGPVENDSLYFIHRRPDIIEHSALIADGIYLGGDFKQAVSHINTAVHPDEDIKLFIGYCGWDPNQLEAEIDEGSWLVTDAAISFVLKEMTNQVWDVLYAKTVI